MLRRIDRQAYFSRLPHLDPYCQCLDSTVALHAHRGYEEVSNNIERSASRIPSDLRHSIRWRAEVAVVTADRYHHTINVLHGAGDEKYLA